MSLAYKIGGFFGWALTKVETLSLRAAMKLQYWLLGGPRP